MSRVQPEIVEIGRDMNDLILKIDAFVNSECADCILDLYSYNRGAFLFMGMIGDTLNEYHEDMNKEGKRFNDQFMQYVEMIQRRGESHSVPLNNVGASFEETVL
jgi:DNA-binding transcriptional regulator WhiA